MNCIYCNNILKQDPSYGCSDDRIFYCNVCPNKIVYCYDKLYLNWFSIYDNNYYTIRDNYNCPKYVICSSFETDETLLYFNSPPSYNSEIIVKLNEIIPLSPSSFYPILNRFLNLKTFS